jgi:hypothetical protein
MARTLQAKKQAFHFVRLHVVISKTSDILRKCVELRRDENNLVQCR